MLKKATSRECMSDDIAYADLPALLSTLNVLQGHLQSYLHLLLPLPPPNKTITNASTSSCKQPGANN